MNNSKIYRVITTSSKAIFFVFALFLSSISVHAQDIITLRNGDEIRARVTEISASEIRYKRFDNLDGPTIVLPRADVFFINYENGTREIITPTSDAGGTTQPTTNVSQGHARQQQQVAQRREPRQQTVQRNDARDYSRFCIGLSVGAIGPQYSISNKVAYFFNHRAGLGLEMYRYWDRWLESYWHQNRYTFLGPAFYYHLRGQHAKFFFPNSIGIGISYSEYYGQRLGLKISCSAGVAYRPARWFSVGLNMHGVFRRTRHTFVGFDPVGNYVREISFVENYFYFGPTLGINFHF